MLKTLLLGLLMLGTPLQSMIDIDGIGINKQALFFGACKQGNIELVEKLINAGVDVNALDSDNKKPALMMGVISGWSVELVKLLINSGANVNYDERYRLRALHYASQSGRIELVKILIKAGSDINAESQFKDTALRHAIKSNNIELVNLLISIDNLKVTQEDFDVALRYYRIDILKILQEYYQVQEVKKLVEANAIEKSVVTIQNNSNNSLNVIHTAEIPAHSKAVITTEISKI